MSLTTVIGRGHSGTRAISATLSQSGVFMGEPLNGSGDLLPPGPMYDACRVFARYVDWEGDLRWRWDRALEADLPAEFTDLIYTYLQSVLNSGAEHRGWKIPETTLCFPWIVRMFPDANYIFWIRDPRDCVVGSHVTDDLRTFGIPYGEVDSVRHRRALSWQYQYQLVKATPHPAKWLEVRLEDFILQQEMTLGRLEDFLGFPLARIPVRPEVIGRWQQENEPHPDGSYDYPFFTEAKREYGYNTAACVA